MWWWGWVMAMETGKQRDCMDWAKTFVMDIFSTIIFYPPQIWVPPYISIISLHCEPCQKAETLLQWGYRYEPSVQLEVAVWGMMGREQWAMSAGQAARALISFLTCWWGRLALWTATWSFRRWVPASNGGGVVQGRPLWCDRACSRQQTLRVSFSYSPREPLTYLIP